MSPEENKSLIYGFLKSCSAATEDQICRIGDTNDSAAELERDIRLGFSQVLAPEYIEHGPRSDTPLEELIQGIVWLRTAFPDLTYKAEDVVDGGDKVVVRYSAHGTHLGPFIDVPPSGKEIEINGIYIARVEGGKIAEGWYASSFFSAKEIFEQLRFQLAMATDPFVGTWNVNLAKSKLEGLGLKSGGIYCESLGNGIRSGFEGVDIEGKPFRSEWSGKYDGKDYPLKGNPAIDTSAMKRIDMSTIVGTDKKAGTRPAFSVPRRYSSNSGSCWQWLPIFLSGHGK